MQQWRELEFHFKLKLKLMILFQVISSKIIYIYPFFKICWTFLSIEVFLFKVLEKWEEYENPNGKKSRINLSTHLYLTFFDLGYWQSKQTRCSSGEPNSKCGNRILENTEDSNAEQQALLKHTTIASIYKINIQYFYLNLKYFFY